MTKIKPKKVVVAQPASSSPPAENHSTFNLCKLIKILNRKKLFALKWLQKVGMLNRETTCDNCGRPMTLVHRQNCTGSRADKYEWECNKCRMCTKSLRNGTVFQSSKLSLQKITILMYFWSHDFPPSVAQRELSITEKTVNKWYLLCQEACMDALIRNTSKLGGEGRNLEVIEGKLGKRAMDNYRTPAEHPVIGVIDVENGSCFLQVVIGNVKGTLLTLLKERIKNGSTLHSRSWKAHDCYSDEKFCKVVRNHRLTLNDLGNEHENTFQKLHVKVCKLDGKGGREFSFDPILCSTVYKNAMKSEEFFFVKFLGELGTLYRDGIRYEMMNQLEQSEPEAGPSGQQRDKLNHAGQTEWSSALGSPCSKCRSKQYSDSEVQATSPVEITVCDDTPEAQNSSVPERNARRSGRVSEGNDGTSDDVIMLEDTCKSQNGVMSEQTARTAGYSRQEQASMCDEVMEVEEPDKLTSDSRAEKTANTSRRISEADCAEPSEVLVLEKNDRLSSSSERDRSAQTPRRSSKVGSSSANEVVLLEGNDKLHSDSQTEEVGPESECQDVIDIGGDEPKDVSTKDGKLPEAVGHIDEIDISMEEQSDVQEKVDERETSEANVDDQDDKVCEKKRVERDGDVLAGGDSEPATRVVDVEDSDIALCEQKDAHTDSSATTEGQVSKVGNADSVQDDAAEEKVAPVVKMIVAPSKQAEADSDDLTDDDDVKGKAAKCTVKHSDANVGEDRKRDVDSDMVDIDDVKDTANERSETNENADRKREAADTVDIGDGDDENESPGKRSKTSDTAGSKRDGAPGVVNLDDVEDAADKPAIKHDKTNAAEDRKRGAVSDVVDIADVDDTANEYTVKRSKTVVNVDTVEVSAREQKGAVGAADATPKRKRDSIADVVNIDDVEGDANERKGARSKTNSTASRKMDADTDVVDIDDVEDNADGQGKRRKSADRTARKESATFTDVIDVDDVDSDVEVIETETQGVPDVMVVGEEKKKVCYKDESRRHERRLLIDDVPCSLSKSVLRIYFEKFGSIEYIKILPLPSRRSLRYAVLEFKSKLVVDTIQAARPHALESGLKLVTFRGSSPDIDTSLNTRLKERVIVKAQKDNGWLTTDAVQKYFSGFGPIYHIERLVLSGAERGSATFAVSFEDYDSADVACIRSPHTIRDVRDVMCEKLEDDEVFLSGTETDPICIENDSDVEEIQIDDTKEEPSSAQQSEEAKNLNEPSTSGTQSGGGKRLSEEATDVTTKKFCNDNQLEGDVRTPQNSPPANPTASVSPFSGPRAAKVTNGRFGLPARPGGSGYGGRGGCTNSWQMQSPVGRPFNRCPTPRQVRSATPGPPAAAGRRDGVLSVAVNGVVPGDRSVQTIVTVGALLAAAIQKGEEFRKRQDEVRPYRPQPPVQHQQFQVRPPQWQQRRRPCPFQQRQMQQWPPIKRESLSPPPPMAPVAPQRVLPASVPIASAGLMAPSHVTRSSPWRPPPSPAPHRNFCPRAAGQQGQRF